MLAESDETVLVDGNHHFPPGALRGEHLQPSQRTSVCPWKGTASSYDVVVGDARNPASAWYCPNPRPAAAQIKGHVAFWKGVRVEPVA